MQHPFSRTPRGAAGPLPALVFLVALLGPLAGLGGCVYRINIQQGNFLDPKAIEQVVPGMPRSQVRFLLGTPMVGSAFDDDRWDYVYYMKRGRARHPEQRKITVFFDGDKVSRIERPSASSVAKADPPKVEPAAEAPAAAPPGN